MSDRIAKLISMASAALLIAGAFWIYGYYAGIGRVWPGKHVDELRWFARSLINYGEFVPLGRRMKAPEGAAREPTTVHDPEAAMGEGHYAFVGWNTEAGAYGAWLQDAEGREIHRWIIDPTSFAPDFGDDTNYYPHGVAFMPDGELIVGFDQRAVMVRLDACSMPVWTQAGHFHHSMDQADDGGIWTWYAESNELGHYQYMVKFDPADGKILEQIGLVEDVIPHDPVLFSLRPDTRFVADDANPPDYFHPNDVEELSAEMADAFPMFAASDLLISLRNLNMVAVIGPDGVVKWVRQGPWRHQHDPDFQPDGTISVFNNNIGRPRSDITVVDPASGKTWGLFSTLQTPFQTDLRGKHQFLPNGNALLTIPEQGRALEVTPGGTVAVEFNNLASMEGYNEDLANARWLPPDYFDTLPDCAG